MTKKIKNYFCILLCDSKKTHKDVVMCKTFSNFA